MINKDSRESSQKSFYSGDNLEKILISQFKDYKKFSLAYIDKNTGSSVISKLEMMYFDRTFERKLRVDFIGYTKAYMGKMLDSSVFVSIEAKNCLHGSYLPFSMIKPHQLDYLYNIYSLGGISFFVIGFPEKNISIKLWANPPIYNLIRSTMSSNGTFSSGMDIEKLKFCAGDENIFDYCESDFLCINNLMI